MLNKFCNIILDQILYYCNCMILESTYKYKNIKRIMDKYDLDIVFDKHLSITCYNTNNDYYSFILTMKKNDRELFDMYIQLYDNALVNIVDIKESGNTSNWLCFNNNKIFTSNTIYDDIDKFINNALIVKNAREVKR